MVRHKLLRQRINKEAWDMKVFTANELKERLNNYPNMDGRGRTRNYQVSIHRLANLLKQNPYIEYIPDTNLKKAGKWKWVGDEE